MSSFFDNCLFRKTIVVKKMIGSVNLCWMIIHNLNQAKAQYRVLLLRNLHQGLRTCTPKQTHRHTKHENMKFSHLDLQYPRFEPATFQSQVQHSNSELLGFPQRYDLLKQKQTSVKLAYLKHPCSKKRMVFICRWSLFPTYKNGLFWKIWSKDPSGLYKQWSLDKGVTVSLSNLQ